MTVREETNEECWEAEIFFDPADSIYADHFPGNPVVPGSLITHALLSASRKLGLTGLPPALENFGFKQIGRASCRERV